VVKEKIITGIKRQTAPSTRKFFVVLLVYMLAGSKLSVATSFELSSGGALETASYQRFASDVLCERSREQIIF